MRHPAAKRRAGASMRAGPGTSLGTSRGGAKPLPVSTRGRHRVDPRSTHKQATNRNSSLRGSIPKGGLEGGQADPPQTPRAVEEYFHTLMRDQLFVDLTKGARLKFGERPRPPARRRERPVNFLASASASPCGKAPRRGRTSSPPWRRRPTLGLLMMDDDRS